MAVWDGATERIAQPVQILDEPSMAVWDGASESRRTDRSSG